MLVSSLLRFNAEAIDVELELTNSMPKVSTKIAPKVTSKVTTKVVNKAKESASELEEILAAETEGAIEQIEAIHEAESNAQSTFLGAVVHFAGVVEEHELSDEQLVTLLRTAYAEIHNKANPKSKVTAEDFAGKKGQENPAIATYVTELKKIKRFVFPAEKKAKAFKRHLQERVDGKANYTIGSLYQEAQGMADATEAGKRGRKPGASGKNDGASKSKKGKDDTITDAEVALTEISVTLAKIDWSEVDIDEVEEGIANLIGEHREKIEAE